MRFALGVEYDGTNYVGFQSQFTEDLSTIQETLEKAISQIADHPVSLIPAGRTDAGVHATGQIIHFDTDVYRSDFNWILGINSNLPQDISVKFIKSVSTEFHARFSAIARCYEYKILNTRMRQALMTNRAAHFYFGMLDAEKMHTASQYLLGEHDFSSFRAASCQSHTPFRRIDNIKVERKKDLVIVSIQANAFLHHMVRNITGLLLDIGSGKKPIEYAKEVLNAKNRSLSSPTAKACGLYLTKVIYPKEFEIEFE